MVGPFSLERLPHNVLTTIISHTDSRALNSLMQTSQHTRALASPLHDVKRRLHDAKLQAVADSNGVQINGDDLIALMQIRRVHNTPFTYTLHAYVWPDVSDPDDYGKQNSGIVATITVNATGIRVDCRESELNKVQVDFNSNGPQIRRRSCRHFKKFITDYIENALPADPDVTYMHPYPPHAGFPFVRVNVPASL